MNIELQIYKSKVFFKEKGIYTFNIKIRKTIFKLIATSARGSLKFKIIEKKAQNFEVNTGLLVPLHCDRRQKLTFDWLLARITQIFN